MSNELKMPALGQTTDEMLITAWLKQEGDTVRLGEPLLEVETDKATLEIESAIGGTLVKIVYQAGETVRAGETIAFIGSADMKPAPPRAAAPAPLPLPEASKPRKITPLARRMAQDLEIDVSQIQARGQWIRKHDLQSHVEQQTAPAPSPPPTKPVKRIRARPTARYLARQHDINLSSITGSGPDGLIEKHDVQHHVANRLKSAAARIPAETPVPPHRQVIAQRMTESAQTIPQIRLTMSVDMTQAKQRLAQERQAGLESLTLTHLILRAVASALEAHPQLNSIWLDDGPRYQYLGATNVGLAVAHEDNLIVVTIPQPDKLSLQELAAAAALATERARGGKLHASDLAPAAITVSNLGMYHVDDFQALVYPGQSSILAVGRVVDDMKMSLSVDHRVADGAAGAQFLNTIRLGLEKELP